MTTPRAGSNPRESEVGEIDSQRGVPPNRDIARRLSCEAVWHSFESM